MNECEKEFIDAYEKLCKKFGLFIYPLSDNELVVDNITDDYFNITLEYLRKG